MKEIIKSNIWLIVGVIVFSSLAAVLETVSLAVIAPLLNMASNQNAHVYPFPFNQSFVLLNSMDTSHKLQWIAGILVLSAVVKNAFFYANIVCCTRFRTALVKHYRMACVNRVMKAGFGYINRKRGSDLQQVFENHIENSVGMMVDSVGSIQPHVFTLILLVFYLFSLSVKLTLLSIALVAAALFVLSGVSRRVRQSADACIKHKYLLSQIVLDILQGMKIVRLFGREKFMVSEVEKRGDNYSEAYAKMTLNSQAVAPMFEICGVCILGAILLVTSLLVVKNPAVYSTLLIFILIWIRIIPPVKALNSARAAVVARIPWLNEVNAFLKEAKEESIPNGRKRFEGLNSAVTFKDVSFQYTAQTPVVLNKINMSIPKGARVGVVGASGSGKSTLSELLLRFYDPQEGAIFIDGRNIKDFDIVSWRKAVGVVTQDTFLFHDTVRHNIAFADPSVSEELVIKAAKRAHAHDFIEALPQGYDTRIGDRGVLLSGGQRQRIAIARAILNEPQILIFDEATSALDSESERYVQQALDEVAQSKTVITIAHRLSTVMNSDWIVVVEKGKIVEQGTSAELLKQNSFYKKLVDMQRMDLEDKTSGVAYGIES